MCYCDAGFTGPNCAVSVELTEPAMSWKAESDVSGSTKSIAMFIDAHTSRGIENIANVHLAKQLAVSKGYQVTIFTADPKVAGQVQDVNSIQVEDLPKANFGGSDVHGSTALSLAVYHTLSNRNFDLIFFDANSNAGFHVISGHSLGAKCLGARILVGVTQPASGRHDAEGLTSDYLRQKTIELGVCITNFAPPTPVCLRNCV